MYRTVRTVVWEVENSSSRGIFSYSIAKFFSKRRKSRDIPGISANQTRRLLLTADQLFHRIRKGLPDAVCFLNCLWSLRKQLSVHSNMAPHLLLLCFFWKKVRFLISKVKKKIYKKHPFGIKFHSVFVIASGIKFRKIYIFFFFIFKTWAGRCPPAAVHLQDALT